MTFRKIEGTNSDRKEPSVLFEQVVHMSPQIRLLHFHGGVIEDRCRPFTLGHDVDGRAPF